MSSNPYDNDTSTPVSFFKNEIDNFVKKRKWTRFHTPKNLVQALHCESGELSQLLLFNDYTVDDILDDKKLISSISDEIADVFIYLISLLNTLGLDLSQVFKEKMKKNIEKYSIKKFNNGIYYKR